MEIPYERLEKDTLRALIEEFITRQGTDHGLVEIPLEEKVEQVQQQLIAGKASIVYDEETESCDIRLKQTLFAG